jgi:hypothetical protein
VNQILRDKGDFCRANIFTRLFISTSGELFIAVRQSEE